MGTEIGHRELRDLLSREACRLVADPNEAEDLVQECLVVLYMKRGTVRDPKHVSAWCRVVLRNVYRQRLRRGWYTEMLGLSETVEAGADLWEGVDTGLVVKEALTELPPRVGRTVRAFYFGGQSVAEIAAAETRPAGTIKRWLHEGREALRMSLAEPLQEGPLARVYASNWLDDAKRNIVSAVTHGGYRAEVGDLREDEMLPTDAALYVFGEQVGCRTGLELLLCLRGAEATADRAVVLFGPGRESAVLAAWQAGADCYLTDPSSPEVAHFMRRLREC